VQSILKGEAGAPKGGSILGVVAARDRAMIEEALAKAAGGRGVEPVDAALAGEGERWARFYVTPSRMGA